MHRVILPKITSDHFPIIFRGKQVFPVKRPFKFECLVLEVDGFSDFVKSFWAELLVCGSVSFYLGKEA